MEQSHFRKIDLHLEKKLWLLLIPEPEQSHRQKLVIKIKTKAEDLDKRMANIGHKLEVQYNIIPNWLLIDFNDIIVNTKLIKAFF